MNFTRIYNKLFFVMQWSVGFAKGSLEQIIREKNCALSFKWITPGDNVQSIADSFLLKDPSGEHTVLHEDFSETDVSQYGKIVSATLDKESNITSKKKLLDAGSHASYPFVFTGNNVSYIVSETSKQDKVLMYEYDFANKCLAKGKAIIYTLPLLDSSIFEHHGRYWLFATLAVNEHNYCMLYIYYADNLSGPYLPDANNPVKNNKDGSRPAGNIIKADDGIRRPAQNYSQYYGTSIAINTITKFSESDFQKRFIVRSRRIKAVNSIPVFIP